MVETNGTFLKAFIEAKKKFKTLVKNKVNPHFKSRYADLAALHDAVDDALAANGFAVTQPLTFDEKDRYIIKTELTHVSGESKTSVYPLPLGLEPQKLAAAITYGRRNALSSLLGIPSDDDDDGNGAQEAHEEKAAKPPPPPPPKKDQNGMWGGKLTLIQEGKSGEVKFWTLVGENGDKLIIPDDGGQKNTTMHAFAENCCTRGVRVVIEYHLSAKKAMIVDAIKEEA